MEYKSMDGVGRDPDIVAVERHLSELLGIGVAIQYAGGGKGALTVKFASLDQLNMIFQRLSGAGLLGRGCRFRGTRLSASRVRERPRACRGPLSRWWPREGSVPAASPA